MTESRYNRASDKSHLLSTRCLTCTSTWPNAWVLQFFLDWRLQLRRLWSWLCINSLRTSRRRSGKSRRRTISRKRRRRISCWWRRTQICSRSAGCTYKPTIQTITLDLMTIIYQTHLPNHKSIRPQVFMFHFRSQYKLVSWLKCFHYLIPWWKHIGIKPVLQHIYFASLLLPLVVARS